MSDVPAPSPPARRPPAPRRGAALFALLCASSSSSSPSRPPWRKPQGPPLSTTSMMPPGQAQRELLRTPYRRSSRRKPIASVRSAQELPRGKAHIQNVLWGSLDNTPGQPLSARDAHRCWAGAEAQKRPGFWRFLGDEQARPLSLRYFTLYGPLPSDASAERPIFVGKGVRRAGVPIRAPAQRWGSGSSGGG
jgi:hypothetical protein